MKLSEIVKEKLDKVGIKPAKCKGCETEIIFLRTGGGKLMPLELNLSPHWKNCTNPQQFRRKDSSPTQPIEDAEPELDEDMPI